MQLRARWSVLVVCAALTACAEPDGRPRPVGTLEPSITQSSPEPSKPEPNIACRLLTSEEREDLVRMSMDAEVPVKPANGTEECIWTHSLNEPARSAIRVIALEGATWAREARQQIARALSRQPSGQPLAKKLEQALADLSNAPTELTDERICEIYFLNTESYGMQPTEGLLFYGAIGAMPAVFAASCEDGRVVMVGFGEHGLRGSIAANHAVSRLLEAAKGRAEEVLRDAAAEETADDGANADESPSPEPSPDEEDETDAEEEEDS